MGWGQKFTGTGSVRAPNVPPTPISDHPPPPNHPTGDPIPLDWDTYAEHVAALAAAATQLVNAVYGEWPAARLKAAADLADDEITRSRDMLARVEERRRIRFVLPRRTTVMRTGDGSSVEQIEEYDEGTEP